VNTIQIPPDMDASRDKSRTWSAGTLVYTGSGVVALFAWLLLGDFAWSMRDRSVGPMAQWYLNSLGVPNLLFGLLISSFPALIGLILSPIISVKSDRHRGKLGRRIPFLLITTPLAAAGMIGVGVTPLVAKWVHAHYPDQSELLISLLCFAVFWAAFEFATIASQAVFGGLVNDVVPSSLLGRFYGLFRAVSLIDGMIFNWWIMGFVPTHFTLILVSVGIFYGIAFFLVCLRVKEGSYPSVQETPGSSGRALGAFNEMRRYFRECFSNPYFVGIFALQTAASLSFFPVNTFTIPFATSLGVDMGVYGKAVTVTFGISLGLSYFLGWLSDIFHPLRMVIVVIVGYLVVSTFGFFLASTPSGFIFIWVFHGVLSGCYFTCAASLGQRLFPRARFAQFASATSLVLAVTSMVAAPAVGAVIDHLGGNYRVTFIMGSTLSAIALGVAWFVYQQFKRLGGSDGYQAPE